MSDQSPRGFPAFERRARELVKTPERVQKLLSQAVRKMSSKSGDSLLALKDQLGLALALVRAWISGEYRDVSTRTVVIVVAAILYFVVPLDTIPDFLFGWGLIDDMAVLGYVFTQVRDELDAFALWRDQEQTDRENNSDGASDESGM